MSSVHRGGSKSHAQHLNEMVLEMKEILFDLFLLCTCIMFINIKMLFFFYIGKTETLGESPGLIALFRKMFWSEAKGWSSMEAKAKYVSFSKLFTFTCS